MNLSVLVLSAYLIVSVLLTIGLFVHKTAVTTTARIAYLATIALHFAFILKIGIQTGHIPLTTPAQASNMTIFLAAIVLAPFICRGATVSMGAFFAPFAAFVHAATAPQAGIATPLALPGGRSWYPLHTMTVITGEALFLISAVISVVYLIHERSIRRGEIHASMAGLPPLTLLDRLLYLSLIAGFIFITIGMISGSLWAGNVTIQAGQIVPKAVSGALVWLVFAFVLHQRFAIGWQGRRTAIITLIGFGIMVSLSLAVWGFCPGVHGLGLLK